MRTDTVDERRVDLKAALREVAAETSGDAGPHVGLKRLIAYRQGTLPAAEVEAVQEHLSLCTRCAGRLLELRDFEAASASGEPGPPSLRQEAWDSLVRRLPSPAPAVRPIAGAGPREATRWGRVRYVFYGAAAALLLAVLGLSVWSAVAVRQERQRLARLEQRLAEREEALAAARRSLANAERQLAAARAQVQELEKERIDRPKRESPLVAVSREIAVAVAPWFALRGQENAGGLLRAGGAVNPVRLPASEDRFTVVLSLADRPAFGEYRFELMDRNGKVIWSGRRPGKALLGDRGTSVSVSGLGPGLYRLRIEGLQGKSADLLAEYVLAVERQGPK